MLAIIRVSDDKVIRTGLVQELLAFGDLGLEVCEFAVHVFFCAPPSRRLSLKWGLRGPCNNNYRKMVAKSTEVRKNAEVKRKSDLVRISPRIPRALSVLLKKEMEVSGVKMEFLIAQAIGAEIGRRVRDREQRGDTA